MTKFRFKGERMAALSSSPPGVMLHVKPGDEFLADAGFEYLKDDPRFEVLGGQGEPDKAEKKAKK